MSSYKDNDATLRPLDGKTGEPLVPKRQPGYYAGFSTLSQSPYWDDATRKTVTERVEDPPTRRFFSEAEWKFWRRFSII